MSILYANLQFSLSFNSILMPNRQINWRHMIFSRLDISIRQRNKQKHFMTSSYFVVVSNQRYKDIL